MPSSDPAREAAFFDLDNTLLRGSSMYYLARGLITKRILTPRQVAEMIVRQARFIVTGAEGSTDLSMIVNTTNAVIGGRQVAEVVEYGQQVFDQEILTRLWPEALELVDEHLRAGREVWLVTSSGQEVADRMAEHLGMTGAIGTRAEIEDGRYTGRMAGPVMHGKAKAVAITALAAERRLDLDASYAYSDSANDIPMLSLVGHPVAVNPDRTLREWAGARGAGILDFAYPSRLGHVMATVRKGNLPRISLPRLR